MSRRFPIGVFAIVSLVVGAWVLARAQQPPERRPDPARADRPRNPGPAFSGKPIIVFAKDVGVTLEEPEIRQLETRTFVVGKEAKKWSQWTRTQFGGGTVWVPLENVTMIVELESLQVPGRGGADDADLTEAAPLPGEKKNITRLALVGLLDGQYSASAKRVSGCYSMTARMSSSDMIRYSSLFTWTSFPAYEEKRTRSPSFT